MQPWDPVWSPTQKPVPFVWEWIVFGDPNAIVLRFREDKSWWFRMKTKILLGSKWNRL